MGNFSLLSICLFHFFIKESYCKDHLKDHFRCHLMEYRHTDEHKRLPHKCVDNEICRRNYTITYVSLRPYSDYPVLEPRLRACCGNCTHIKVINSLRNMTELDLDIFHRSDFIYPVLGSAKKTTMYGYYFLPVCPSSDYVYVTRKYPPVLSRLLKASEGAGPLIFLCLLMTTLSGFVTWIFETWSNKEEFPRPLFRGWFEGIWWSFISMTTVGYGDKTPRTVLGRLHAIVWILIGITFFGILTGLLTKAIIDASEPREKLLKDEKVGILRYRIQDAALAAEQDGHTVEDEGSDFTESILDLLTKLREKKIDGFLLDKPTYWTAKKVSFLYEKSNNSDISEKYRKTALANFRFFETQVMTTDKRYNGDELSYGVLAKNKDVYEFLRDAMADNSIIIKIEIKRLVQFLVQLKPEEKRHELISFHNETFQISAVIMAALILLITVLGLIYTKCAQKYPAYGCITPLTPTAG